MLLNAEEDMPLKWVYMQINYLKHTSRRMKSWFMENRVVVMEWPSQSTDLNPIETLRTEKKLFIIKSQKISKSYGMFGRKKECLEKYSFRTLSKSD